MSAAHAVASSDALPGASVRCAPTGQNNAIMRALLTLPPVSVSTSTSLAVPEMPVPKNETGDREIDAVLWLQECVRTGQPVLIEKALDAAKKIKTPMKVLGNRYGDYLLRTHRSPIMAAFGSMGFGDLESQAQGAIEREAKRHAALSRFGTVECLFADTPAERACKKALRGLKCTKAMHYQYDDERATDRFAQVPELRPSTLDDCLYARAYWAELYRLRCPFDECGDPPSYSYAPETFCFAMLAEIKPRNVEEALAVFEYMDHEDAMDRTETPSVLRNLITSWWA